MGDRNVLLLARPEDAQALAESMNPLQSHTGLHLHHHNAATLSLLYVALVGGDVTDDNAIGALAYELVCEADPEDGPWLYRIPDPFWTALTGATDAVAARWKQADLMEHFDLDELDQTVAALQALRTTATQAGLPILLWCSA